MFPIEGRPGEPSIFSILKGNDSDAYTVEVGWKKDGWGRGTFARQVCFHVPFVAGSACSARNYPMSPGVYQLLAQQQTRYATFGVGGKLETVGPAFSVRSPGWRAFCVCRGRGLSLRPPTSMRWKVSCRGQL
jgi:hypothetical protein